MAHGGRTPEDTETATVEVIVGGTPRTFEIRVSTYEFLCDIAEVAVFEGGKEVAYAEFELYAE